MNASITAGFDSFTLYVPPDEVLARAGHLPLGHEDVDVGLGTCLAAGVRAEAS